MTAQRLLVEKGEADSVPLLKQRALNGGLDSIHALWALKGLSALDQTVHQAALLNSNPALRQNAIRALGDDAESARWLFDTSVLNDADLGVRREALTKMAHFERSETLVRAVEQLFLSPENRDDPWLSLALKTMAGRYDIGIGGRALGENLLSNPSFELGSKDAAAGWKSRVYGGQRDTAFSVAEGEALSRTGKRALMIRSDKGADAGWYTDVPVKPNTEYRLSGWIKTQGVRGAMGGLFNVHGLDGGVTKALQKKNDWTLLSIDFNSGGRRSVTINCLFGGWGTSTGTAYYDDLSLQEIMFEPTTADTSVIAGDAARGEKIFRNDPVASCFRCHQLGGEGGVVGPYLDGVGARKQLDYLRESLVNPQAKMAEGFTAGVSPMPPFGVLLKVQELEDVLAFLQTLKTEPDPATLKPIEQPSFE